MCEQPWSQIINKDDEDQWSKPGTLRHASTQCDPVWDGVHDFNTLLTFTQKRRHPVHNEWRNTMRLQLLEKYVVIDVIKGLRIIYKQHTHWLTFIKCFVPMMQYIHQLVSCWSSFSALQTDDRQAGYRRCQGSTIRRLLLAPYLQLLSAKLVEGRIQWTSVHMFITHRPTLTLQLHNFEMFRTCRTRVSALLCLCGNWQDFNWHDVSCGPSAIAELLVILV